MAELIVVCDRCFAKLTADWARRSGVLEVVPCKACLEAAEEAGYKRRDAEAD